MASDVYIFNASNDSALACDALCYSPTKYVQLFENDLATLPMFFASEDDIVLVDELPSNTYLRSMQAIGFTIPHFITKHDFFSRNQYERFQLKTLKPWGWSKTVHTIFRSVKDAFSDQNICMQWNPLLREMSGRHTAEKLLKSLLNQNNSKLVSESAIPIKISNINDIPSYFSKSETLVLKAPWSSSGRGLMRISPKWFTTVEKQWAQGIIDEQGFIMLEPWHNKIFDFSMLFDVSKSSISLLSFSTFITNEKGQFQGSYIHFPQENPLSSNGFSDEDLFNLSNCIIVSLMDINISSVYEGWIGLDAMLIDDNGTFRIHPCVECNCRYTIGHLAFELRKFIKEPNALLRLGTVIEFEQEKNKNDTIIAITPISQKTKFVGWITF